MRVIVPEHGQDNTGWICRDILAMPAPDRIALARELLEGTGMVVAREVGKRHEGRTGFDEAVGWNACRAAMMGDDA
jgi:hypothetical protein